MNLPPRRRALRSQQRKPVSDLVGDITYIATRDGWLYLATVISLQTRQVLGYSFADRMPDDLIQQAFVSA